MRNLLLPIGHPHQAIRAIAARDTVLIDPGEPWQNGVGGLLVTISDSTGDIVSVRWSG